MAALLLVELAQLLTKLIVVDHGEQGLHLANELGVQATDDWRHFLTRKLHGKFLMASM